MNDDNPYLKVQVYGAAPALDSPRTPWAPTTTAVSLLPAVDPRRLAGIAQRLLTLRSQLVTENARADLDEAVGELLRIEATA